MDNFHFELIPFRDGQGAGRRGTVGDFGEVTVLRPTASRNRRDGPTASRTLVMGDGVPEAVFRGRGAGMPGFQGATLHVKGSSVAMERNPLGVRPKSRALQLDYQGRKFSYTHFGVSKGSELKSESGKVTLAPGRHIRRTGTVTAGVASGDLDALSLVLAVIFEEVNTSSLTLSGAASMVPIRLITYNSTEPS